MGRLLKRYEPHKIEPKWQDVWEQTGLFRAPAKPRRKHYVIPMFPYPSADGLHVGHPRPYTAADITAHFQRAHGREVLHTLGWDAFGLPAENAAIKKGVHPAENTAQNIETFRRQLKRMGFSYDWQREVNTADPAYYRWTQWIFLQLFKAGLAYRAEGWQWWCPNDKTVLANEQVIEGKCERCGHEVTKKQLTQWYFKVTDYADELIDNLEELDWPESIKALQRNWIGRSHGAEVVFATPAGEVPVYTTRPDTLFGATYLVLAPEHPLVDSLTSKKYAKEVTAYVAKAKTESDIARSATDKPKTGVFTGSSATNPVNGEEIPIWVGDYVLPTYGTGAIMAVPAHDGRDYAFAQKYDLPIRTVVMPETGKPRPKEEARQSIVAVVEDPKTGQLLSLDWGERGGVLFIGGGKQSPETAEAAARREITEETGYHELELVRQAGPAKNHYISIAKGISRVARADLLHFRLTGKSKRPVTLEAHERDMFTPQWISPAEAEAKVVDPMHAHAFRTLIKDEAYGGEGLLVNSGPYDGLPSAAAAKKIVADLRKKKLAKLQTGYKLRDWLISRQRYWGTPIPIIHCPKCGPVAVPEADLPVELPELDDYLPTGDGRSPLAKDESFVETTCPECGGAAERETDTMDTFADSSWYFLRYPTPQLDTAAFDTAALKAWLPVDTYVGGADHAVLHLIYARFWTMALADLGHLGFREPFRSLRNHGMIQAEDGQKMSKSKGNVVSPDEIIEAFGADTFRTFEMFIGPYDQAANWDPRGIEGVYRFLKRVYAFGAALAAGPAEVTDAPPPENSVEAAVERALARGIQAVTRSIEQFRFNTAVSSLMELLNELTRLWDEAPAAGGQPWRSAWGRYLVLLAPFAPHLAEELWQALGHENSVLREAWPTAEAGVLAGDLVSIPVQVNGKVRTVLDLPADQLTKPAVLKAALADAKVTKHLAGATPKVIYVPGRLLNLVA
jgi:leucyl-tRNA synthetase